MNFQDPGVITAALTSGGALLWAYAIQFVLQVIKSVPQISALLDGREKLFCFITSFVVVVLAFAAALGAVPPTASLDVIGVVGMVLAGFNIARLAMSAYDDFIAKVGDKPLLPKGARPRQSVLSPVGWTGRSVAKDAPPRKPR